MSNNVDINDLSNDEGVIMRVYGEKNIPGRGKSECENLEARECLICYRTAKQPVFLELRDIAIKMVSLESGPEAVVMLSHKPE